MKDLQHLRSWWEFASTCQFFHLFFDVFTHDVFDSLVDLIDLATRKVLD